MVNSSRPVPEILLPDNLVELNERKSMMMAPVISYVAILMSVGFIGNSLVLYVYWFKTSRKAERTFIMTLAILDIINCLLVMPFEMFDLTHQYTFDSVSTCKTMRVLEYSVILASGFVLVSVSFDRYFNICKTFSEFSPRKAKVIGIVCAIIATVLGLPAFHFAGIKETYIESTNLTGYECSMLQAGPLEEHLLKAFYFCLATIFLLCIVVLSFIYSLIGIRIRKWLINRKLMQQQSTPSVRTHRIMSIDDDHRESNNSEHSPSGSARNSTTRTSVISIRTAIIFFSVTAVFIISFLPHITVRFLQLLHMGFNGNSELVYNFIVRSYLINSAANPFVYTILNSRFRGKLKDTFRRCFRRSRCFV
ncbi:hypothetical protein ACJMK2_036403 [Sinanodonta woodiana]|uniref:G-protein coupled receptors family 1 profile domain-containing protein n=1 Tax=Sinanodonta woodiana TaxID=1069815 RepID=A0ABD3WHF7_SINWO